MLGHTVQERRYDWEPLVPAALQAYPSPPYESTNFTPAHLVFGRKMQLPIDIGTTRPEPPRDNRTYENILSEDLELAGKVAHKISGTQHNSATTGYNDHVVEKLFKPGDFMRVFQHKQNYGALSNLGSHYTGFAVKGPILTIRKLDTRRELSANHDTVRL